MTTSCVAGTDIGTADTYQWVGQSSCSYILVEAENYKQVKMTWTSNIRLQQVLEENKTEVSDDVRGATMNSLVCVVREGVMEKVTLCWDLNDRW